MRLLSWIAVLFVAFGLSACSLILDTEAQNCTQDGDCAGETICQAGVCVHTDGGQFDGQDDGDGGTGDGDQGTEDGDDPSGDDGLEDGGGDGCTNVCTDGESVCEFNQARVCAVVGTGCTDWLVTEVCSPPDTICDDTGAQAECLICDPCTTIGYTDCLGNFSRSCTAVAGGQCWLVESDCADDIPEICALGGTCRAPGSCDNASCNAPGPHFAAMSYDANDFGRELGNRGQAVVEDSLRGLTWQGCPVGTTGDMCTGTPTKMDWTAAISHCQALEWGPTDAASYTDWYLPDRFELHTIVAYGQTGPAIDEALFPGNTNAYYWSSSTMATDASSAWKVNFFQGNLNGTSKTAVGGPSVRCVRRTTTEIHFGERFSREAGGPATEFLVTDNVTGLIWQGCPLGFDGMDCLNPLEDPGSHVVWPKITAGDAGALCTGLNWGGIASGWRLPNIRELASIADDRTYGPATYSNAFPYDHTVDTEFWSSDSRPTYVFTVDFDEGKVGETNAGVGTALARCVYDPSP